MSSYLVIPLRFSPRICSVPICLACLLNKAPNKGLQVEVAFPRLARGDVSSVRVARRTFSAPCCLRALREQHSPWGRGSWRWLGLALAGPCSGAMAPGVRGCSGAGPCRASPRWGGCTEAGGGRAVTGLTARTAVIWLIPC